MGPVIKITHSAFAEYRRTVARHEPETCLLLGGRLDQPNLIDSVRFCPPRKVRGRYQSGGAHISLDADLMNWIILNEWEPQGRYILGIWHSHPGGFGSPSGWGGDLQFFSDCLATTDARANNWTRFLAPITTFDIRGQDYIHPWIYERGGTQAAPADMVVLLCGREIIPQRLLHPEPHDKVSVYV